MIALTSEAAHNVNMETQGVVQNGVVVLPPNVHLADGTVVVIHCLDEQDSDERRLRKKVRLPLIASKNPSSLHLTNDMIAEFLNDTEISR